MGGRRNSWKRVIMSIGKSRSRAAVAVVSGIVFILFFLLLWHWGRSAKSRLIVPETSYIPHAALFNDMAVLDLRTALVFELADGYYGYVFFVEANMREALYVSGVFKKGEQAEGSRTDGKVSLTKKQKGETDPQRIVCGSFHMHWLPPTSLFFCEDMQKVALIPFENIEALRQGTTNVMSWSVVKIPPM